MRAAWKLAALALVLFAVPVEAQQNTDNKRYMLFNGSTPLDSLEKASPWIPIRGANRIIIRSWTTHPVTVTSADTLYSDSIAAISFLFSDTCAAIGRDSAGTIVALHGATSVANRATAFPLCSDSLAVDATNPSLSSNAVIDTSKKLVMIASPPVREALSYKVNGAGLYSYVVPTAPASIGAYGDGSFTARFMRVRYTPLRRLAVGGDTRTTPLRVLGLKGFRMEAEVIYNRK